MHIVKFKYDLKEYTYFYGILLSIFFCTQINIILDVMVDMYSLTKDEKIID